MSLSVSLIAGSSPGTKIGLCDNSDQNTPLLTMGNIRLSLLWVFVRLLKGSIIFVRLIDFSSSAFLN